MLLKINKVTVHYSRVEALRGVSLTVEKSEVVAVMGANGAGKTTLVRSITGLKPLSSGEIWFNDVRIDGIKTSDIVGLGIAVVPEGRRVFPYMTVMANLRIGAYVRNRKREIAEDIDRMFEYFPTLKNRAHKNAGTLSGGEQQMLAIGRALMAKPILLVVDELSVGLSPVLIEHLAEIIADLNRSGLSIFLVEQNAYMALQVAQRGYILETGNVLMEGSTRELLSDERVKKSYLGG